MGYCFGKKIGGLWNRAYLAQEAHLTYTFPIDTGPLSTKNIARKEERPLWQGQCAGDAKSPCSGRHWRGGGAVMRNFLLDARCVKQSTKRTEPTIVRYPWAGPFNVFQCFRFWEPSRVSQPVFSGFGNLLDGSLNRFFSFLFIFLISSFFFFRFSFLVIFSTLFYLFKLSTYSDLFLIFEKCSCF